MYLCFIYDTGNRGATWYGISIGFSVVPNEDFYFVFAAVQRSDAGIGGYGIDDVTLSEGNCQTSGTSCRSPPKAVPVEMHVFHISIISYSVF